MKFEVPVDKRCHTTQQRPLHSSASDVDGEINQCRG
jgi:hypothetical protein